STQGKKTDIAKDMELKGWDYPKHLAGRLFSVIVHGDTEGAGGVRRSLSDWLRAMELVPAGSAAEFDRYIGYWKPYATSHEELDRDEAVQDEVRNAAWTLLEAVKAKRAGALVTAGENLHEPRHK
ncbi:MAG: NADPH-dependent FMN reductase, partial [Microvirga sp.]